MTLTLRTPGELIAALPTLLGFEPVDSIVVIGLGSAGTVGPILRLDRADCLLADGAESLRRAVAGQLTRHGVRRVVLVSLVAGGVRGGCAVLDAWEDGLEEWVEVLDAFVVSEGRFRSARCDDIACCPRGGRPVPQAPAPAVPTHALIDHERREEAPFARRKSAAAAAARSAKALRKRDAATWRRAALDEWRKARVGAMDGHLPSDATMGRLAASLGDVALRDALVVDMVPGEQEVAELLCADPAAPGVRDALAAMLTADAAVVPDRAELEALVALVEHGAWLCSAMAGPFLTLAALASWWRGDEDQAREAVAEALAREPGYRLAELVSCALNAGLAPGWIAAS